MIIVLILTSIVVGLAFSVLSLVQRHMLAIQQNYNKTTELNRLETALWLDFNRYTKVRYSGFENELRFSSPIDSVSYKFYDENIIKETDTFNIRLQNKMFFLDGETAIDGKMDAIKLVTSKNAQTQVLFIYKENDASNYMN
ncbi:hypothetical protein HSX10_07300 [Winogradskyella undariae]|nr:hypothetical protein [Winogradskyella undariae]